jgi:hypothetical protein
MKAVKSLKPHELYRDCDPHQFEFETTADLDDLAGIIGQARAAEAIEFGIGIRREGYNLFTLGPSGIGKSSALRHFIEQKAAAESAAFDWCYVNDFDRPQKPCALRLPPGTAVPLRQDIEHLIEELHSAIPAVFEIANMFD